MKDNSSGKTIMSERVWPIVRVILLQLIFFIGILGNLVGWGVFVLMVDVLHLTDIEYRGHTVETISPSGAVLSMTIIIIFNLFLVWMVWRFIDRKRWKDMLLSFQSGWGHALGWGMLVGLVNAVLVYLGLWLSGAVIVDWGFRPAGSGNWGIAVGWLVVSCVLAPIGEEVWYRGYVFQNIKRGWGLIAAGVVSSLLFGGLHLLNPNAELLGAINIALHVGVYVLGILLSGSLWFPIGAHAAWNFTQFFIFGLPNSGFSIERLGLEGLTMFKSESYGSLLLTGGEFGIEASIITTVVFLGMSTLLFYLYRQQEQNK